MRADVPELLFKSRGDFREWLKENAETSEGVWLVLGKTKAVITLSANDALEEALCFGWIDGQMKSIDETKYRKYFARRRAKSVWSEKNKKAIDSLRAKGIMTESGERAIETARQNGTWNAKEAAPVEFYIIDDCPAALPSERKYLYPILTNTPYHYIIVAASDVAATKMTHSVTNTQEI